MLAFLAAYVTVWTKPLKASAVMLQTAHKLAIQVVDAVARVRVSGSSTLALLVFRSVLLSAYLFLTSLSLLSCCNRHTQHVVSRARSQRGAEATASSLMAQSAILRFFSGVDLRLLLQGAPLLWFVATFVCDKLCGLTRLV